MANKKSSKSTKKVDLEQTMDNLISNTQREINMEDFLVEEKKENNIVRNIFLGIVLIISCFVFILSLLNSDTSNVLILKNLFIMIFTILFVVISIKKSNKFIILGSLCLSIYFLLGFSDVNLNISSSSSVPNFSGKSLTEVMKWASKNNVTVNQEYEYSDMIPEYQIISQDVDKNTKLKDLKEITVSVSEGANPSKEIIIPSMITWDSDRVLKFVKDNYLSNVNVEFVESDKAKDTVIEQSASGNLKRDDELNLVFSYGEELGFTEVTLIDLTEKSKFEVEFYMKQNQLNYEFDEDFDNDIKRGYVKSQKINAGEVVPINDVVVGVTLSKGPEIKVPNLTKYSMTEITEWAIKNKLKLSFSDKYDDSIKENSIISTNYNKGDIVEQGTVIEVVISRGALKMPKFKTLNDFYTWANKYGINYEEVHEFSDTVSAGEVISYSYKKGQAIKNGDTIKVTVSDGNKKTVPNLKGLSKSEATSKLEKAGLKYTFIYSSSNTVKKNYVISQSISSGSEISEGITITVTLSNGEKSEEVVSQRKASVETSQSNNNSNNSSSNSSNNNSSSSNTTPEKTCNACTITGIRGIISSNISDGFDAVSSALVSDIKSQCPGITVNIVGDDTSGKRSGLFISGFNGGDTTSCSTISITLAK